MLHAKLTDMYFAMSAYKSICTLNYTTRLMSHKLMPIQMCITMELSLTQEVRLRQLKKIY